MLAKMNSFMKKQSGSGEVRYGIILLLVVLVAVSALTRLGGHIADLGRVVTDKLR